MSFTYSVDENQHVCAKTKPTALHFHLFMDTDNIHVLKKKKYHTQ